MDHIVCSDMIAAAVQAPSPHNSQPWLFRLNGNTIIVSADKERRLPVLDPHDRELFISLGCAVENMSLTAAQSGYSTRVSVAADKSIHVGIEAGGVMPDSLFTQISRRQSNRQKFNGRNVSEETLKLCCQQSLVASAPGRMPRIRYWAHGDPFFTTLQTLVLQGNDELMNDPAFAIELKSWLRLNKSEAQATRDGLSSEVVGAPSLPGFIGRALISLQLNSRKQNKEDGEKIATSSHFVLFTNHSDAVEDLVHAGRTLQRFLLSLTQANVACAFTNQPCEVPQLREELQNHLAPDFSRPQILLRIGYAKAAPRSLRRPGRAVTVTG